MGTLPFVEGLGHLPEHSRPRYTQHHSLADLERLAWASNDRATLGVIELAEDAAGLAVEEVRERRAEMLAAARGVLELKRERDELRTENIDLRRRLARADELANAVYFVLRPFARNPKAPKWADHLRRTMQRIGSLRP